MRRGDGIPKSAEPRAWSAGALRAILGAAGALFVVAAGGSASCGDWVSIGPYVRCGVACEPVDGKQCGRFGHRYNRSGKCVCAQEANCVNYPCSLPEDQGCFIAGFDAKGACVCVTPRKPGACGQPCDLAGGCGGRVSEYNEHGVCACGPAACPCGQVCPWDMGAECFLLRQYDENGDCACAPVKCPNCEGEPCCSELCGTDCTLEGCVEDGSGSCDGFCSKTNECVKGAQTCAEVP